MGATKKAASGKKTAKKRRSFFSHRHLIAVEAVLVLGALKDWLFDHVRSSDLSNAGKVLFVMATTVGVFGGMFLLVEKFLARGVERTHSTLRGLSFGLSTLAIHAVLFVVLFLVYAKMMHLTVL